MMELASNADLASQYALRVALQTMKERCIALQRRLTTVEEENRQLRDQTDDKKTPTPTSRVENGATENFQLRLQVAELNRQKTQLDEHINMVSNENRKLWSRLSQMAKEQGRATDSNADCTLTHETDQEVVATTRAGGSAGANQNLIRSKTFTQHSPNPHLRHKMIDGGAGTLDGHTEKSLEGVNLGDGDVGAAEMFAETTEGELGFAYLNVGESGGISDADMSLEVKRFLEGLQEMRREAIKQKQELSTALTGLKSRITAQPCLDCAQKAHKPEMADKSLETDDRWNEVTFYKRHIMHDSAQHVHNFAPLNDAPKHLNIIQEKIGADNMDKICPMCGKTFTVVVSFNDFREHVETHFIDELDRSFDFITHTVSNF